MGGDGERESTTLRLQRCPQLSASFSSAHLEEAPPPGSTGASGRSSPRGGALSGSLRALRPGRLPPPFLWLFLVAGGWGSPALSRAFTVPGNGTLGSNRVSRVSPTNPCRVWRCCGLKDSGCEGETFSLSLPPPPTTCVCRQVQGSKGQGLSNSACCLKE